MFPLGLFSGKGFARRHATKDSLGAALTNGVRMEIRRNSFFAKSKINSKLHLKWRKPTFILETKSQWYLLKEKGFCDENMSLGGSEVGENVKEWPRVPILRQVELPFREGQYGKHLAVKHPGWGAKVSGPKIYQVAMMILRDLGDEANGRKINSRGTSDDECGSVTGVGGEDWGSIAVCDWFLAL